MRVKPCLEVLRKFLDWITPNVKNQEFEQKYIDTFENLKVRVGGFFEILNAYLSQNVMKHYID